MRLDRYLSQGCGMPRSEALKQVRFGKVAVNGKNVRDAGHQVVVGRDVVLWRGQVVRPTGHLLVMLNKPAGVITSTEEGNSPTVMSCIPEDLRRRDLAPIGRLDKDTTGLLLLTTDGGLNHALTHPRRHVEKAYLATLSEPLPAAAVGQFAAGIDLADGTHCAPATLELLGDCHVRVILREGKYHQVKRMVAACGSSVVALHRERVGDLWLDPALQPGMARAVSLDELALLGVPGPGGDGAADPTDAADEPTPGSDGDELPQ